MPATLCKEKLPSIFRLCPCYYKSYMENVRLFRQFRPKHYELRISMNRQKRSFTGSVAIEGESTGDGAILLHAHRLRILSAHIDGEDAIFEHGEQDVLSLDTPGLRAGQHKLALAFEGGITDSMHGLYPCYFTLDGQDEELLMTQFESHHAREVFPCVDEPEAKATFSLTLESEANVTVVSNTPIKAQREQDGKLISTFETTPVMSTYLLAWVAGKLDYKHATTQSGVTVGAYATRGKGDQLDYALEVAVKELEFMDAYFGVSYPLAKCDLVAVPDFSSGAMENWGCITFRESIMLVGEHSSTHTKQFAAMVIAHELAHQWFGDLVTMRWWNDLWLNESFANWMEYYVPDKLYPEWQLMTQYYSEETVRAIERDGLASVQTIQQDVRTPQEIQALFDPAIVYAKGGSLINMLHAYMGDEPFRKGLQLYFERHRYGNTEAADLWNAWGEVSRHDIRSFMLPWITQSGLPVVTVGVSDNVVSLGQRRFFNSPRETDNQETVWPIPLLTDGQLSEDMLAQANASLQLQNANRPLLLNKGRTGYYLTMYDHAHMQKLATELRDGALDVTDRTGLLSDSLSLSVAGLQAFAVSLELLNSYRAESSMPVWEPIRKHIAALKVFAGDDETLLSHLRRYVHDLTLEQYDRLGWKPIPGEPYFDELLRPHTIALMAYAEDDEAITRMLRMFDHATNPADVWADIRRTVFGVAAQFGNTHSAFDKLLAWYKSTTSAEERTQLIAGLTATREPKLIQQALTLLTTDDVRLQDLFYWIIGLTRNRFARDLTWRWMRDNWQWIVDRFGNDLHYADFPKYISNVFSTPEQLEEYKRFFGPMRSDPGVGRTIVQGIEDIDSRVQWLARDGQAVEEYLRAQ